MKKLKCAAALAACWCLSPLQAHVTETTNVPDSVSLFSYATPGDEGRSGLKFAWSPDGNRWFTVGDGYAFVRSDYGAWGAEKRMVRPQLYQEPGGGAWHCVWQLNGSGKELAHAASPDLLSWKRQTYFTPQQRKDLPAASWRSGRPERVTLDGVQLEGSVMRVAWADVERLPRHTAYRAYIGQLHDERTEQDPQRFAGLKPVHVNLTVDGGKAKPISDKLIGVFFEDINYGADGGLYAELIQNRDFEYSAADRGEWNATTAWSLEGKGTELRIATDSPIHPNNPHYAVLDVKQPGASLSNGGYDGIVLHK